MREENWITKYSLRITVSKKIGENYILILDDMGFILKSIPFQFNESLERYYFYFENYFLNDFLDDECLPQSKLLNKIEKIVKEKYLEIIKKMEQINLVLNVTINDYYERRRVTIFFIKNGKKDYIDKVVEENEVDKLIQNFKKELKND